MNSVIVIDCPKNATDKNLKTVDANSNVKLTTGFTRMFTLLLLSLLTVVGASAQIGSINSWTSQYASATYPGGVINASYAIPNGNNRLLVVAIATTRTAVGAITISSVTYGGTALTLAAGDATGTSQWSHSAIYYLKDASIASAAAGKSLNVTCSGGTSYYTYIAAAVFSNVDQTSANPFTTAVNFNNAGTGTTSVGPLSSFNITAKDTSFAIINLARATTGTTSRTISTFATNWATASLTSSGIITSGPCFQAYVIPRSVTTAATGEAATHTASSSVFSSYTAMSIKYAVPTITGSATATAFTSTYGTASTAQSFTISGANLTANLVATAPTGFEVSADGTTYGATASFTPTAGTGAVSGTLRIRLAATAVFGGTYNSQNITLTSTGATTVNIATASTGNAVSKKALTVSSAAVTTKEYDGTTAATITGTLTGIVNSDVVTLSGTGTFASAAVATGVTVTSTSTISGTNSGNYSLTQPTGLTGNITKKTLTVTGLTGNVKTYDGLTSATATGTAALSGVVSPDVVTLGGTGSYVFTSANVGTAVSITTTGFTISGTNSGNYTLTQPTLSADITAKALTVTGLTGTNKTYDGLTSATATGTAALSGVVSPDVATLGGTGSYVFTSANVGTAVSITTTGFTISGANSGNYSLIQPALSADITTKALTITASDANKTYGTVQSTPVAGSAAFTSTGLVGSQTIGSVTMTYGAGALTATAAVGSTSTITPSAATGGTFAASNYSITYTAGTLTVTTAPITVTATGPTKAYGTALATETSTTNFTVTGSLASGETLTGVTLTPNAAGSSATTAALSAYTVTPSLATGAGGFLASNYNITYTPYSGTVTKTSITIVATGPTKEYGTALTAATSTTNFTVTGSLASGETLTSVTLTPNAAGTTATTAAASAYTVTPSLATGAGGFLASNYTMTYTAYNGTVSAKPLTITASDANKAYGTVQATPVAGSTAFTSTGLLSGQTIGSVTMTYGAGALTATAIAGSTSTITPSAATGGTGGFLPANYIITYTAGTLTVAQKALTVTGITANNKVYDGLDATTLNTGTATLVGIVSTDVVTLNASAATGTFVSLNAANGISVTASGLSLSGANAGNYTLTQPTGLTANITRLPIVLSGTRVYDGTTLASSTNLNISNLVSGDVVSLTGTGSLAAELVGSQAISAPATPVRVQSATGNTGGTAATTISVTVAAPANGNTMVAVISTRGTSSGRVTSITQTGATWTRAAQSVGTAGTTTEIWYAPNVSGAGTGVTITQTSLLSAAVVMEYSGILTASPVDVAANTTGNSTAASTGTTATTTQANELLIGGIGLLNSGYTLGTITNTFTSVANSSSTNGTAGNNARVYALEKIVTATGTATTGGTVSTSSQWSGAIATFKAALPSGTSFALTGADAVNYTLSGFSGSMTITAKALTVTGVTANNKVYNGLDATTLNTASASLVGVISPDVVTVNNATASGAFASVNVATGISVTASGLSLSGTDAGNYTLTQPTGLTATITALPITISGTRAYDGTTLASSSDLNISNLVSGDDADLAGSGSVASANIGTYNLSLSATPVRVQSATGNTGGTAATSFSVTVPTPVNGNTMVAVISTRGTSTGRVTSISQTGATWTRAAQSVGTAGTTTEIWYAPNVSGAGTTITINQASLLSAAVVMEYKGILTASPLDVTANTTGSSNAASTGTTATTTQANELLIGGIGLVNSGYTLGTITNTFTSVASSQSTGTAANNAKVYALEKIVTAAGTATSGGTVSTSSQWSGAIATFKAVLPTGTNLSLTGTDAANYSLTGATGSMTITAKALTITANNGNKTYGLTQSTPVTGSTAFTSSGLAGSESIGSVTLNYGAGAIAAGDVVGSTSTITPSAATGGTFTGANYNISYVTGTLTVTPPALTITGITANNKVYDALDAATFNTSTAVLVGIVSPDVVYLDASAAVGTFANINVGTGISVAASGFSLSGADAWKYMVNQPTGLTANITAKPLTLLTDAVASNKIYDGNANAVVTGGSFDGVLSTDIVSISNTGTFSDKNVGTGKSVTILLTGANAANYSLVQANLTADITAKPLTIGAASIASKVYDGTVISGTVTPGTLSGFVLTETVGRTAVGTYADNNVGNGKTATIVYTLTNGTNGGLATNYSLADGSATGNITAKALTITGAITANKEYDGTVVASVTGGSLVGVISPDVVVLTQAGNFANKTVGTNKAISSACTISGADAGNYSLTQPALTARNITAKPLTVTGAVASNKIYNGNTTAIVTGGSLVGVISPDVVNLTQSGIFSDKNVGTGKSITGACSISGTDAANYSITQPLGLAADITAADLTITANDGVKCVYTTYTFSPTAFSANLQSGDVISNVTLTSDGADQAVDGGTYVIVPSNATGALFNEGNYNITYVNGTLSVVDLPYFTLDLSTDAQTVCVNSTATSFSVTASAGSGTISGYQWYRNTVGYNFGGTSIPGATSTSYTPATNISGIYYYYCVVTNSNGCTVESNVSEAVTINALPTIVTISGAGTDCNSRLITAANGSSGTIYFQGTTSGGTSTATPSTTQNITISGTYYFRAQSAEGCWGPEGSAVLVLQAPIVTGVEICAGGAGSLSTSTSCDSLTGQTAGPNDATTGTGTGWTSPGNIGALGSATISVAASGSSNNLQGTGYGFAIPSNATINGITVNISRQSSSTSTSTNLRDNTVSLVKGGTVQSTNKATTTQWTSSLVTATYGGTSDLWGSAWTVADINATNFGVVLSARNLSTTSARIATIDFMQIIVTYTIPGNLNWYNALSGGTLLGSGTTLNPVGVTGSGIVNTNTPGTIPYYAECSSNPGCRGTANFKINPILNASVIIATDDADSTICEGTNVTFTATPTNGGTAPVYQWKKNGSNVGTNSATYSTTALVNNDAVTVVMTSNATPCLEGSPATSNSISTTVNPILNASVTIESDASANTICAGTNVTFTATPTNGGTAPVYQWKNNGSNVGTNSATYSTTALVNNDAVTVVMTSNATPCLAGSPATSNSIPTTVNANQPASVTIVSSDADNKICTGTSVTFTATPANGGASPAYQWKKNGSNVGTNSNVYTTTSLVNGDIITVVLTSNATPCLTESPATSDGITTVVNSATNSSATVTSCDSYNWNSNTYTASGTYTFGTTNANGCDSTATLILTIIASTSHSNTVSACDSYTWLLNGQTYTASGTYSNVVGCHTELLNLTITASTGNSTTISSCDSYIWSVNGQTYTASGTYTDLNVCYTETLHLTITTSTNTSATVSVCDSYLWSVNAQTYTASGTYTSVNGCHSDTLHLTITASSLHSNSVTAADTYTWTENSQTYTTSGTYTSVTGCHTEELILTIVASTSDTTTITACDTYTWTVNSQVYTTSGTYTSVTGFNTKVLLLTLTASSSGSTTITSCDSYTWTVNGQTYTASGTYTDLNACHTEILNLTITASTNTPTTVSACDSYTWTVNGTNYTQSGTYTDVVDCHTETLHLTVTASTTHSNTVSACDTYTWTENGQTYTVSGTYTNVTSCHTEVLNLTIITSSSSSSTITACDSYYWSLNGQTYTASGTYTDLYVCHTETLNLTITASSNTPTNVSECDSYTWAVTGTTYTQSGTYTNVVGCHTETLNLTLNANHIDTSATVCGLLVWYGDSLRVNGTFTKSFVNRFGCDSIITLQLVVNPLPTTPGAISGITEVCSLIGSAIGTNYSIASVADAVSYLWTVPTTGGVTILSGQNTTSINVSFDNSLGSTNQRIRAYTISDHGCYSDPAIITLTKSIPSIGIITGQTNVCEYMGTSTNLTYSVDAVSTAASYIWTAPTGGTIVSGQGTRTVEVNFSLAFVSGQMSVIATSNCGNSRFPRTLSLTRTVVGIPVSITGPVSACPYFGNSQQAIYSIADVANATSYLWTVPTGVNIVSGQGTTSIVVTFLSSFVSSSIKVRSVVNCSSSGDRALVITGVTYGNPNSIIGPANGCYYINNDALASYTTRKMANVSAYVWTVPNGITIVSHPGGTGENDTIINVTFNTNFVFGTAITVQASGCGLGPARSLPINGTVPYQSGMMSGPTNVCEFVVSTTNPNGNIATYKILKNPSASGYVWTAPANATIISHPGGIGINDTSVQIKFNSNYVSGTVSVSGSNACGVGASRTISVRRLNVSTPGVFDVVASNPCPNRIYTYTMAAFPMQTTSILWTYPANATYISGQGTLSLKVSYPPTQITGTVTAKSVNNCSMSAARSITIKMPACPSAFTAPDIATQKGILQGSEFSVNVYPNPSTTDFKIAVQTVAKEKVSIRVMDMQGRMVKSYSLIANELLSFGNDLKPGSYIVETKQGNNVKTTRVVKF